MFYILIDIQLDKQLVEKCKYDIYNTVFYNR